MPDRTVEGLVADSVRVLDAAPVEPEWRRGAFAALLRFHDELDTRSDRDVLREPLERAGLLGDGEQSARPLPLPQVALEVCRRAAEARRRELVAAWYKVLGVSLAERDRLGALKRDAAARELREIARGLNAGEIPVPGYEPASSDARGTAAFAWWFEEPEGLGAALSATQAIEIVRGFDAASPPVTRFGTLVAPAGAKAAIAALAKAGPEAARALTAILESPSTGYHSAIAAAQALVGWLKANAKRHPAEPDRADLARRLARLIEQGMAAQEQRSWLAQDAPQGAFRWIDRTTGSDDPVSLLEELSDAYCRLGPAALPAYRENAQRALSGTGDLPAVYLRAPCMQPGKAGLEAALALCDQLLARREEFAGVLGILGWAPGIRKEVRERLR